MDQLDALVEELKDKRRGERDGRKSKRKS
jgi:hypothetical protein